jgi:hypothetical protein
MQNLQKEIDKLKITIKRSKSEFDVQDAKETLKLKEERMSEYEELHKLFRSSTEILFLSRREIYEGRCN